MGPYDVIASPPPEIAAHYCEMYDYQALSPRHSYVVNFRIHLYFDIQKPSWPTA